MSEARVVRRRDTVGVIEEKRGRAARPGLVRALHLSVRMTILPWFGPHARVNAGFTLIEVSVALAMLATSVLGLVQVFTGTARATGLARRMTVSTTLAAQKLDQLRSLAWTYDAAGVPVSDTQTDTTVVPELVSGGRGLAVSPSGSLETNADGFCDFLDAQGRSLGGGTTPPLAAAYVRRWLIQPLPADPADTLVLQVRLLSREAAEAGAADPGGVTLTTVRTRVMW